MDQPQVTQGRRVRPEEVALIRDWLRDHPHSNRTRLSRELCSRWNWRNGVGQLKDMAARSLLLKLEAQGQIELPPRRSGSVNGLRNRQTVALDHDQSLIQGALDHWQPVQLEPLAHGATDAALFRFLLQRYHYLGHRNCVGENLKYLAHDRTGRVLACLLFGSAAWKVAGRDGWTPEQRRGHLCRLTNNTRMLILPKIPTYYYTSPVLGCKSNSGCFSAAGGTARPEWTLATAA